MRSPNSSFSCNWKEMDPEVRSQCTSLALCNRGGEALTLDRADHPGTRKLQLNAVFWLLRRCGDKSRRQDNNKGLHYIELRRKFSWRELLGTEAFHTSFILRGPYDVLPSPSNLNQWYREDPTCPLCPSPANLKHILVGCKKR